LHKIRDFTKSAMIVQGHAGTKHGTNPSFSDYNLCVTMWTRFTWSGHDREAGSRECDNKSERQITSPGASSLRMQAEHRLDLCKVDNKSCGPETFK
jgi:hypothetical protein